MPPEPTSSVTCPNPIQPLIAHLRSGGVRGAKKGQFRASTVRFAGFCGLDATGGPSSPLPRLGRVVVASGGNSCGAISPSSSGSGNGGVSSKPATLLVWPPRRRVIGGGAVSWHRPGARPDPNLGYHSTYFGQACAVPCAFAQSALCLTVTAAPPNRIVQKITVNAIKPFCFFMHFSFGYETRDCYYCCSTKTRQASSRLNARSCSACASATRVSALNASRFQKACNSSALDSSSSEENLFKRVRPSADIPAYLNGLRYGLASYNCARMFIPKAYLMRRVVGLCVALDLNEHAGECTKAHK